MSFLNTALGRTVTSNIVDDSLIPVRYRLPEKFTPHILNGRQDNAIRKEVNAAFSYQEESLFWGWWNRTAAPTYHRTDGKEHIRVYQGLKDWIIKFKRTDVDLGDDANLYRVRKARKIRRIIEKNGWQHLVTVPEKHLYFDNQTMQWYVVAQKLQIRKHPNPFSMNFSVEQTKAIAQIALEANLVDLHGKNLVFDEHLRVAIIDTEPINRAIIKETRARKLLDVSFLKLSFGLKGTNMLKSFVSNDLAKKAVSAVQWRHVIKTLAVTALKVSGFILSCRLLGMYPVFLVTRLVQFYLILKIVFLAMQVLFCAWQLQSE